MLFQSLHPSWLWTASHTHLQDSNQYNRTGCQKCAAVSARSRLVQRKDLLRNPCAGGKLFPILPRLPCVLPVSSPVFRTQCAGTRPPYIRMGQTQRNLPDAFSGNRLSGLRRIIPSSYMRSTPSTWSGFPLSPLWYRRTHGSLRLLTDIPGMHGHIHGWWRPHLRLFRWSLQK